MEEKNLPQEKKPEQSSVFIDIAKQTRDEILIPRLLDTANTAASQTIYGIADYFTNCIARKIFANSNIQPKTITRNSNDRGKYATTAKSQPQQQPIGSRSSATLQYIVISANDPKDRLDASDYDGRKKAESIKNDLINSINTYGKVRVADLYEKSGKAKPIFTDYNYGWTNVNDVHYIRNSDGWWFNMPNPTELSK